MFLGLRTVIYPAGDLAASKAWYEELLGFAPYFDEPFYVGFNVGGYELGLIPDGSATETYWGVSQIQDAWKEMLAKGARPKDEPKEVGSSLGRNPDRPAGKHRRNYREPPLQALSPSDAQTLLTLAWGNSAAWHPTLFERALVL